MKSLAYFLIVDQTELYFRSHVYIMVNFAFHNQLLTNSIQVPYGLYLLFFSCMDENYKLNSGQDVGDQCAQWTLGFSIWVLYGVPV